MGSVNGGGFGSRHMGCSATSGTSDDHLYARIDLTFANREVQYCWDVSVETPMHVISRKKLREIWTVIPELKEPLRAWVKVVEKANWKRFSDVRETLKSADRVEKFCVFNILGNRYRLICVIHYNRGKVYIRHVLTHGGIRSRAMEARLNGRKANHGQALEKDGSEGRG